MPLVQKQQIPSEITQSNRGNSLLLLSITAAFALLHILTNGRYGFHRDELQFLSDARHLDWGFVAYPPLTPFLERISMGLFGLSLVGLRLFSVLAQAVAIVVSGLMARDLGGGRWAQAVTAVCVGLSPLPIFEATEFQYSSFDFLWWVLITWFTIRLLGSGDPRWWLAIGAAIGLGLQTKYSIAFFIAGILAGMLFTSARRYFASRWFWAGVGIALLIFLPNFVWLVRHDFISYTFLQHIHVRDVRIGRAKGFLLGQFLYCANLAAAPVWIAGLIAFTANARLRMLAWMYIVPVALFWIGKGRFYYVAALYPMLLAMGNVVLDRWFSHMPAAGRRALQYSLYTGIGLIGVLGFASLVPLAPSGPLRNFALSKSSDLREEIGWNQLVKTVASIRDSLPPEQRSHLGITTGNYGEYGAIDVLGKAHGLPQPIGTTNSEWLRGYPAPPPTILIVLGVDKKEANAMFTGCRLAGHNGNALGVKNEESVDHPDIFVCGPPRLPQPLLQQWWKEHKSFG